MAARRRSPRRVLVIDVGGTHVKARVMPRGDRFKFLSGKQLTPQKMIRRLGTHVSSADYDAVTIGYPGVVSGGEITVEPHNLGRGWVGYDFAGALGRPVRIINDAAMQAAGSYQGGRMLFLGLGTGLGATLILDGVIAPLEIGHLPYKGGMTFEDHVGERARLHLKSKKWCRAVHEVVQDLRASLRPEYVVVGGGNAKRLSELPDGVYLGDNDNAFTGGVLVWRGRDALHLAPQRRTLPGAGRACSA
jgi:predicted NBD/HSP70 family sugar kinase